MRVFSLLPSYVQIGVTLYPIEGHGVRIDSALGCAVGGVVCNSKWRREGLLAKSKACLEA